MQFIGSLMILGGAYCLDMNYETHLMTGMTLMCMGIGIVLFKTLKVGE